MRLVYWTKRMVWEFPFFTWLLDEQFTWKSEDRTISHSWQRCWEYDLCLQSLFTGVVWEGCCCFCYLKSVVSCIRMLLMGLYWILRQIRTLVWVVTCDCNCYDASGCGLGLFTWTGFIDCWILELDVIAFCWCWNSDMLYWPFCTLIPLAPHLFLWVERVLFVKNKIKLYKSS